MKNIGLIVLILAVTGCASHSRESNPARSSMSEPISVQITRTGEELDVFALIDPEERRFAQSNPQCRAPITDRMSAEERRALASVHFTCAIAAFNTYYLSEADYKAQINLVNFGGDESYRRAVSSMSLALRRNAIQDRLMMRSDALCRDFENRLGLELRVENDSNIGNWLRNSQTRIVGGVGALILNRDIVWALTNAARITGLPGYVHDEDQLEKAVMRIAIKGIDLERAEMRLQIDAKRFQHADGSALSREELQRHQSASGIVSIGRYTLETALADVMAYHAACSIGTGLEAASQRLDD